MRGRSRPMPLHTRVCDAQRLPQSMRGRRAIHAVAHSAQCTRGPMHAIAHATPCTRSTARVLHAMRVHQVMYIFPTSGPQLLMTLTMLGDLYQFLILIAFFMVAFTASFFSLSVNAQVMIPPPSSTPGDPQPQETHVMLPLSSHRCIPNERSRAACASI